MSKYYSSTFEMFSGIFASVSVDLEEFLKYIQHTIKQSQTTMLLIILGTALFLIWVSMRIEVEEFQDEMPFLLGTSEEDNTSEAEAVVGLVFDRNCSLAPIIILMFQQHSKMKLFMLFRQVYL